MELWCTALGGILLRPDPLSLYCKPPLTPSHFLHSSHFSQPTDEVLEMLEDGIVMDPPDNCPDAMYSIMCSCWKTEPSDRPSFPKLQQGFAESAGEWAVM